MRIPINQSGFHGMSCQGFEHGSCRSKFLDYFFEKSGWNFRSVWKQLRWITLVGWEIPTHPTVIGGRESEDANDDVRVDDCSLHHVHHVSGWYSTIWTVTRQAIWKPNSWWCDRLICVVSLFGIYQLGTFSWEIYHDTTLEPSKMFEHQKSAFDLFFLTC